MLSSDDIQEMFGDVLGDIYMDASLVVVTTGTVRNPSTGVLERTTETVPVKVQKESCSSKHMVQPGYTPSDVRFLVLQSGARVSASLLQEIEDSVTQEDGVYLVMTESGVPARLDTDAVLVFGSSQYMVMDVDEDPFRVYWDIRARRK